MKSFPFHKQTKDYTCGPASVQMVFEYFGKHKTQKELGLAMKTRTKTGTSQNDMITTAAKEGFYCYSRRNSTLFKVKHFISRNLPVIVNFIEPSEEEGHYAVIVGYKKGFLILNDPWHGKNFQISEKDFLKRWRDSKNIRKRWMMVVAKKDFQLGKGVRRPVKKK